MDGDGCGGSDFVTGIATIGEELFDEGEGPARGAQQRTAASSAREIAASGPDVRLVPLAASKPVLDGLLGANSWGFFSKDRVVAASITI
ncbi:MAG: hypothetical protein ACYC0C_00565 [Devosia sp.]